LDHLIWHCERFETKRRRLTVALTALDVQLGTPVRDLCAQKKWQAMKCCLDFLGSLGIRIWWLSCPFSKIAGQILPHGPIGKHAILKKNCASRFYFFLWIFMFCYLTLGDLQNELPIKSSTQKTCVPCKMYPLLFIKYRTMDNKRHIFITR
jgi:hypothetical protein